MKMYKSIPFFAVVFALFFAAAAQAQTTTTPAKKSKTAGTEMKSQKSKDMKSPKKEGSWEDELNLTPEQKAKFKKADDDYKVKSKASKDAKKNDMQQLRDERKRAHKATLNADQAKKYDEIMARRDAKKEQKHENHAKKGEMKKGKNGMKKEGGEMHRDHDGMKKSDDHKK